MVCSVISTLFKREPSGDFKQWGWMSLCLEKTATTAMYVRVMVEVG